MTGPLDVRPVILAGGVGRRLWPLSRESHPKPYLKFFGRPSFLQKTLARFPDAAAPVIVASQKNLTLLQAQIKTAQAPPAQIFLEPVGRGTAAAVSVAAHYFVGSGQDPLLLIMPSDHVIRKPRRLCAAIAHGTTLARQGNLVLFGIPPCRPATGFGYIQPGAEIAPDFCSVAQFVEKPPRAIAAGFIRNGWLWNSGIFLLAASTYLEVLQQAAPEIHMASLNAVRRAQRRQNMILLDEKSLLDCPSLSIDRAVMEKAGQRVVTALDIGWRDLGTWPSLLRHALGI